METTNNASDDSDVEEVTSTVFFFLTVIMLQFYNHLDSDKLSKIIDKFLKKCHLILFIARLLDDSLYLMHCILYFWCQLHFVTCVFSDCFLIFFLLLFILCALRLLPSASNK